MNDLLILKKSIKMTFPSLDRCDLESHLLSTKHEIYKICQKKLEVFSNMMYIEKAS